MPSLRLFTIALSLSAQSAYSFAPQALNVRTQPRTAVALQRPNARVARPLRTGAVFATASIPASAAAPSMMSRARSVVLRVATALMCTLATLLLTATRALAAAATKSAAATVGPAITGGSRGYLHTTDRSHYSPRVRQHANVSPLVPWPLTEELAR